MDLSLHGKNILITGVSRSCGIGAELARTFAKSGANVIVHGYSSYDKSMEYRDADMRFSEELVSEIVQNGGSIKQLQPSDLSVKGEAVKVIREAEACYGYIDGLVLNHAYSVSMPIGEWTEEHISKHLEVNVTASMMMIQEFSKQLPADKRGAITLFTSGQYLGPMISEIAYAVSKEAIIGICRQIADALAPQNIQANCINPGPTDTGYAFGEDYEEIAKMFPGGRWGTPKDAARLVHFLQSDYSEWITGQVIASEGGFRRDKV